jgi:hypothetical protein
MSSGDRSLFHAEHLSMQDKKFVVKVTYKSLPPHSTLQEALNDVPEEL